MAGLARWPGTLTVRISRLLQHPIKGFPALRHVYPSSLNSMGRLGRDRERQFVSKAEPSTVINGKWAIRTKNPNFFRIRADYDDPLQSVRFSFAADASDTRHLQAATIPLFVGLSLEEWISDALQLRVQLCHDEVNGFPDDLELPSFTLFSEASAVAMAQWFEITPDQAIARLRPNIVIDGVEAFEEFRFLGRELHIGKARILAAQMCARCTVPGVDPQTGVGIQLFTKRFGRYMHPMIERWTPVEHRRDAHAFYATLNTKAIEVPDGSPIELGQLIEVI